MTATAEMGDKVDLFGVGITVTTYEDATERIMAAARERRSFAVSALAVHGLMEAVDDDGFRQLVNNIDLVTPDGQPVHCMVLILTPQSMPERHLEVLSALSRAIGSDWSIRQQLYHCTTPAHAYELLHVDDGSEDFNEFLEDESV